MAPLGGPLLPPFVLQAHASYVVLVRHYSTFFRFDFRNQERTQTTTRLRLYALV